ncbi:MAG: hypothetical protein A3I33_01415 [Candidatus Colwellbacteria bacterium RIFCSPLOWO2_02_FULL_45_11]|uniref:phosphoserine phosphatase n=1 Tax=Candidatus Colwellbacteria bacterium RIFCSPLOWO2_02_FULL_45_11 TaxID=1797692 RepID=A0A1G1Z908_9BACT|nr:MAG: hypothetical protein A3I33_01415 [Candidatus Colwellbacteria bacterium RIFCSPLOWO2_02_FULL_45_11]
MFKAVIFDLDGTLASLLSWNRITEGLGVSLKKHRDLYHELTDGSLSQEEADKALFDLWVSGGKATKENFLSIFREMPLRSGAKDTVSYLVNKGYKLCIITGAVNLYARYSADTLGIERWFANAEVAFDNNALTHFKSDMRQDEKKLEQFKQYLEEENLEAKDCVPVGDSWNDHKIFEATGNGIAIKSGYEDPELEKIAWKVINELPELKDIL